MRRLEALVPPPVVMAVVAALMWLAAPAAAHPAASMGLRAGLAVAIALAGGAIAAAGALTFRRARTTLDPHRPGRASMLVTAGIYRVSRNPMYLGLALMLVGLGAWLGGWPALAGPPAFAGYITRRQIVPEERALERLFGAEYLAYRRHVRRWF